MKKQSHSFDFNYNFENKDEQYLSDCLSMSPEERFLRGIELSEWSIKLCKNIKEKLDKRSIKIYTLK